MPEIIGIENANLDERQLHERTFVKCDPNTKGLVGVLRKSDDNDRYVNHLYINSKGDPAQVVIAFYQERGKIVISSVDRKFHCGEFATRFWRNQNAMYDRLFTVSTCGQTFTFEDAEKIFEAFLKT